jgi:WhiB family redox-sensing transcriptional regulator
MSAYPGVAQLKAPPHRDTRWQERAACAGVPGDDFFPSQSEHITPSGRRVCEGCDVRAACLEYALTHGEWHGTWGGMSVKQRRELMRERKAVSA